MILIRYRETARQEEKRIVYKSPHIDYRISCDNVRRLRIQLQDNGNEFQIGSIYTYMIISLRYLLYPRIRTISI